MRLVSFDVGIKNLAYCIFSAPDQIVSWTVANLIESNTHSESCTCELAKKRKSDPGKVCGKPAKYTAPLGAQFFCESHAKKSSDWLIPKREYTRFSSLKLADLQTRARENQLDPTGLKKQDIVQKLAAYYEAKCFRPIGSTKPLLAGEIDLITIGRSIKRVLDADPEIGQATHVIIENQISTLASRMKTIQGMIAQYFIMQDREIAVEFVSSHNKLKGHSSQDTDYKTRKADGITICRNLLAEDERWKPVLEASKKKDDLADCFLQGVWYWSKLNSTCGGLKNK